MWETILKNTALFLGLAISAHTIWSVVESRLTRRRQRHALLRVLQLKYEWFVSMAASLNGRANKVVAKHAPAQAGETWANPADEEGSLAGEAEEDVKWLVERADHLLRYELPLDLEKLGGMLTEKQIEALLRFIQAHQQYTEVLRTRMIDLKMFPRKKGVLHRFTLLTAGPNLDDMTEMLTAFHKVIGLGSKSESRAHSEIVRTAGSAPSP